MPRRILIVLFAFWAALSAFATGAGADPVYPQGLRIGLEPAPGLVLAKTFPGFEDPDKRSRRDRRRAPYPALRH